MCTWCIRVCDAGVCYLSVVGCSTAVKSLKQPVVDAQHGWNLHMPGWPAGGVPERPSLGCKTSWHDKTGQQASKPRLHTDQS
jgi:hypothetical protein